MLYTISAHREHRETSLAVEIARSGRSVGAVGPPIERVEQFFGRGRQLDEIFATNGLTSRFLNDSARVHVGQLDSTAADALVSVLGQRLATRARQEAGGFAMGLQSVGHAFWQDGDLTLVTDHFANAVQVVFDQWWASLDQEQRRLLKRSWAGVAVSSLGDRERRSLSALVQRGLAEQEDDVFRLQGAAWRNFVADAY